MIKGKAHKQIAERPGSYPAAALVGPRQCGKATLAQEMGEPCFDLEQASECLRLDLEWDALMKGREWCMSHIHMK